MISSILKPMIHPMLFLFCLYIIIRVPSMKEEVTLGLVNETSNISLFVNKEGFISANSTDKKETVNDTIKDTVKQTVECGYGYINTYYTELLKEKLEYFVEPLPLQGIEEPSSCSSKKTEEECRQLFDMTNHPKKEMIDLREQFKKLDKDPMKPFEKLIKDKKLKIKQKRLDKLVKDCAILSLKLKTIYNRARPYQICHQYGYPIKYIRSKHADTPSYPSSYALQAYSVAFVLGRKYPKEQKELEKIANDLAWSRVYSGNNFVSDIECAKKIVLNLRIYLESVEL